MMVSSPSAFAAATRSSMPAAGADPTAAKKAIAPIAVVLSHADFMVTSSAKSYDVLLQDFLRQFDDSSVAATPADIALKSPNCRRELRPRRGARRRGRAG